MVAVVSALEPRRHPLGSRNDVWCKCPLRMDCLLHPIWALPWRRDDCSTISMVPYLRVGDFVVPTAVLFPDIILCQLFHMSEQADLSYTFAKSVLRPFTSLVWIYTGRPVNQLLTIGKLSHNLGLLVTVISSCSDFDEPAVGAGT